MTKMKYVVWIGILITVSIVLSRFLPLSAWNVKVGFTFVPIVIGVILFGPVQGGITATVADFLKVILFPIGMHFPGFIVTTLLTELTYRILLHENRPMSQAACAMLTIRLVYGLLLNICWISLLHGAPCLALLSTGIVQYVVLMPVQFVTIARVYVLGSKKYHIPQEDS